MIEKVRSRAIGLLLEEENHGELSARARHPKPAKSRINLRLEAATPRLIAAALDRGKTGGRAAEKAD